MGARDRLHGLVDRLPDGEVSAAERYLEYLQLAGTDPVLHAFLTAPDDDEPETEEERAAVTEARQDIQEGRVYSLEEVRRELGL